MSAFLTCALLVIAAPAPDQSITVPFELLKSGHMAVQVKVNGTGPYRFIFDTGAPVTLVNTRVAKAAGLVKNQQPISLFGGGEVQIKRLAVGDVTAANMPGVVMDHPTIGALARALGPLDGIVGFPFFARYRMTIDYQAKTLTFVPSGFKPPDVMRALMLALVATTNDEVKVVAPAGLWGMLPAKDASDEAAGVTLKEVHNGGPAATAGLKAGDRLLSVDGRWTDSIADLYAATSRCVPGVAVTVRLRRDGKERDIEVTPLGGL